MPILRNGVKIEDSNGFMILNNMLEKSYKDKTDLFANLNLFDALREHFGDSLTINEDKLWTFCELIATFYTLKESAEVFGRGGSHYTKNPIQDLLIDEEKTKEINDIILPALFTELDKLLTK